MDNCIKRKIISIILCSSLCAGFTFAVTGCSEEEIVDDTPDLSGEASEVASEYVELLLQKKTDDAKKLTQEDSSSDVVGGVINTLPYEQAQIVDEVLVYTDYKVSDVVISDADSSAKVVVTLTMPDLPLLLELDENYTQESFVEAISDAPLKEKKIGIALVYADEKYLVDIETVSNMAGFFLGIGAGDEYTFSLLTDKSALDVVQNYVAYNVSGEYDKAAEAVGLQDQVNDTLSSNKFVSRFYIQYYSMIDCKYEVTERSDKSITVHMYGYGPDFPGAMDEFMEEDNLVEFFAAFVNDIIFPVGSGNVPMATERLYQILTRIIEERPLIEIDYYIPVTVDDDMLVADIYTGLEPVVGDYLHFDQISKEYHVELLLKGLDYLLENNMITDSYYNAYYDYISKSWEYDPDNNNSEYLIPYEGINYKKSVCNIKEDTVVVFVDFEEPYDESAKFTYTMRFNGEVVVENAEIPVIANGAATQVVLNKSELKQGDYRFSFIDPEGKTVCITTLSVGEEM